MPITSYTGEEYRLLSKAGLYKQDGPWPGEERNVYPEGNYYAQRLGRILGICLHITAGINDLLPPDTSAEDTNEYGRITTRRASWTVCVDSDSICPFLQDHRVAFAQGLTGHNFNTPFLSIEMARKDTDWSDDPQPWSDDILRHAAIWAAPRVIEHGIPLVLNRDRDEIDNLIADEELVGFCYHGDLDPLNRTDPGIINYTTREDSFPIEKFFSFLREEIAKLTMTNPKPDRALATKGQTALGPGLGYDLGSWGVDGSWGLVTQSAMDTYRSDFGYEEIGYPNLTEIIRLENDVAKIDDVLTKVNALSNSVTSLALAENDRAVTADMRFDTAYAKLNEIGADAKEAARPRKYGLAVVETE